MLRGLLLLLLLLFVSQVRHDLGEVMEGETVIVTLADKSLLDEQGNLREGDSGDELENTLLVRGGGAGWEEARGGRLRGLTP